MWARTRGTLFKFVSQGGQFHFMSRGICKRLITQDLLPFVSAIFPPHTVYQK